MSTIWAFDLGKGSIGEAVREVETNRFLHGVSQRIAGGRQESEKKALRKGRKRSCS